VTLTDQLEQWRGWLSRIGAPVAPVLKRSTSQAEIDAVLGSTTPASVREWFQWCDGVEYASGQTIGDSYAVPGFWPVELRHVAGIKAALYDAGSPLLAGSWVPLLEDGGGDAYVAVWSGTSEPVVVRVMPEAGPPWVEFDSIEQMVTVFNACFGRAAYHLDPEHRLDVDEALYDEIYTAIVGRRPVP
jgi:hypothetical protein